jgi:hypothetical protein
MILCLLSEPDAEAQATQEVVVEERPLITGGTIMSRQLCGVRKVLLLKFPEIDLIDASTSLTGISCRRSIQSQG